MELGRVGEAPLYSNKRWSRGASSRPFSPLLRLPFLCEFRKEWSFFGFILSYLILIGPLESIFSSSANFSLAFVKADLKGSETFFSVAPQASLSTEPVCPVGDRRPV